MKTALRKKIKLGLIDGTIKKPFKHWHNTMIINSTLHDPSLHGSISHATTAKNVWLDLEECFSQTNVPCIHQL
ncbi:hypothetical protein CR513_16161, partial [Mucuna pruriens]